MAKTVPIRLSDSQGCKILVFVETKKSCDWLVRRWVVWADTWFSINTCWFCGPRCTHLWGLADKCLSNRVL